MAPIALGSLVGLLSLNSYQPSPFYIFKDRCHQSATKWEVSGRMLLLIQQEQPGELPGSHDVEEELCGFV